jgi:hypothetical protein
MVCLSRVESMNPKTAAVFFGILGVAGILLSGLTLAPTASANVDEVDEDDSISSALQRAQEHIQEVDEDDGISSLLQRAQEHVEEVDEDDHIENVVRPILDDLGISGEIRD